MPNTLPLGSLKASAIAKKGPVVADATHEHDAGGQNDGHHETSRWQCATSAVLHDANPGLLQERRRLFQLV